MNGSASAAVLLITAVGCGQPPPAPEDLAGPQMLGCPNDLPSACVAPAPSWSGAVSALMTDECAVCHAPGGSAAEKPLATYDDVYQRRGAVLTAVYACKMPPEPQDPLSGPARRQLLAWLVCGAPNN